MHIFTSDQIDLTNTSAQLIKEIEADVLITQITLLVTSYDGVSGPIKISIGTNGTYDNWMPETDISALSEVDQFLTLPMNNVKKRFGGGDPLYLKVTQAPTAGEISVIAYAEGNLF